MFSYVYGNTEEQHDQHLKAALDKISNAGLTLSKNKCVFGVTQISFYVNQLTVMGSSQIQESCKQFMR